MQLKYITKKKMDNEKDANKINSTKSKLSNSEADIHNLNAELEQKVIKRTAQYAFLSQINQNIVKVNSEELLFKNSCHIALEFGKFKMAWIGCFNEELKQITLLDSCGIINEDIALFTNTIYKDNGPQDFVLRTGQYFICSNIQQNTELASWKPFTEKYNICSCIVLPIKKGGKIFGTFNLYSTEVDYFDYENIALLAELTRDISYALELLEKTKKHNEAEEKIIKNEKLFRALIENSADMITLSTKEGKMLYGSPSITKLFGYSNDEIINSSGFDFIHPDDIEDFKENRLKLLQSPFKSNNNQIRLKHKNGNWIWCESITTNRLHEPEINALVSNFRDISEKKLIEEQLAYDANNLNALINNTSDLMWSVDTNFNLITSNKPFEAIIEKVSGSIIKKGSNILLLAFPEELLARHKKQYERAFAGETFSEIEFTEMPNESWNEISYYPIRKKDIIIGTACHSRDITNIKKAEKELSKSEAFSRGVLNSLSSHISVIDNNGNIIAVNESWEKYAKQNGDPNLKQTGAGTNYIEVCTNAANLGDETAKKVLLGLNKIINKNENDFYLEYPCHSPQKQSWFGLRALKFEGNIPLIVMAHTDISEQKIAEQEKEKLTADLIQRNQDLEQFTFIISHNLRAPLANIIGIAQNLLDETITPAENTFFLQGLSKSVLALDNVIKDINAILKVKKQVNDKKEIVQFSKLVNEVSNSIENLFQENNAIIKTNFLQVNEVFSIKVYLYSIFYNLITNSIKYKKQNEPPLIEIKSTIEGNNIILTFKDNGLGIDLETKNDKVFGLYNRFHPEVEGKGIGLFMVKTQVEAIGGKIIVESEINKGTVFTITLKT